MSISEALFERANQCIPGGVNSPVRAFNGVGGLPVFFKRGEGAYLYDNDDKAYIDYVGSWGPMIVGHTHPEVLTSVKKVAEQGLSFGAPTELEVLMAEKLVSLLPNVEKVRMVSSGTEATMTAIRMARGITGREKIIKFQGCYHGHSDSLLVSAGSGLLTLGIPSCPGVPASVAEHTLTANFNDLDSVSTLFEKYSQDIAAIIVEPVAGNMGCILPNAGFLQGLKALCQHHQSLLIFDEVMTGFRVALGGAQEYFDVEADIMTYGKIVGGGMPVGAIAGNVAVMDALAPVGNVYQAGTLSGNPVAMAAGLATLELISTPSFYSSLTKMTTRLVKGLNAAAMDAGIPLVTSQAGGMFGLCFTDNPEVSCFEDVSNSNIERFKQFFHAMKTSGVYFAPSAYEAGFVSSAHGDKEITATIEAAVKCFSVLG